MTEQDLYMLSPLLLLAGASVLVMLLIAMNLTHRKIQVFTLILFLFSFISLYFIGTDLPHEIGTLLRVDGLAVFITGLILFASLVVNILSYIYFEEREEGPREYYVLLLLATLGACVLAASTHFVSFFLGLEILTVALYALIAYLRERHHPVEAGVKYLILAAFSSAFLLFGMGLVYLEAGTMNFAEIAGRLGRAESFPVLAVAGTGMMLVGIGFKLAIVPFHLWAADVYQGAPAPITAFIATASKAGVLAVLLRFTTAVQGMGSETLMVIFVCIAMASMVIGNLLALQQTNVKRILAYSSIAHMGYLLVALISGSSSGNQAITFYLVTYVLSTLIAFGVVTLLSSRQEDAGDIALYRGLFWRNPVLAAFFTASLLSLAGIPLTAGFIGKFYILSAAAGSGEWGGGVILVLSSVIGLYYYLRIITAMFAERELPESEGRRTHPLFYLFSSVTLTLVTFLVVWLGVSPAGLLEFMTGLTGR
ncbi:MAG TPA: NADH-quinone oxidoreductase subunit N [Sphingobacteriaceae bacterium]